MAMEMSIGSAGATLGTTAVSTSAQSSDQGFGKLLVQAASGGEAAESGSALPVQLVSAGIVSKELAALLTGKTDEQLSVKLDELLQLLEDQDAAWTEQQMQVDEALEQLNAVFAALFGFPLIPDNSLQTLTGMQSGTSQSDEPDAVGAQLKQQLTELLTFAKSFLQEGLMKPLGKDETMKLHAALDKLALALSADQANTGVISYQSSDDQSVHSHLLRLSKQPVNASLVAVVAEASQSGAKQAQDQAASVQPSQVTQTAVVTNTANASNTASNPNNGNAANGFQASNAFGETVQTSAESQEPIQVQTLATQTSTGAAETVKAAEQPKPVQTVPIQRLSETIAGMAVRQLNLSQNGGVSEARIMLMPEHLGQVDVRITVQNGQLTAQFVAENAAAKEMIENQLAVLRGALQNQGMHVEKLEVVHASAAQQSQLFQEQRQRGQGGQSQGQQSGSRGGQDDVTSFEAELVEQAVRGLGYGRAINVTA